MLCFEPEVVFFNVPDFIKSVSLDPSSLNSAVASCLCYCPINSRSFYIYIFRSSRNSDHWNTSSILQAIIEFIMV